MHLHIPKSKNVFFFHFYSIENRKQSSFLNWGKNQCPYPEKRFLILVSLQFLFLVYINLIVTDLRAYADDLGSLTSAAYLIDVEIALNCRLNQLTQDLAIINLLVNLGKTGFMNFRNGSKPLPFLPSVKIGDTDISSVSTYKYLGLVFDENLSWAGHVDSLASKVSSGLFVLRRVSQFCSLPTSLSVYYALIESHLRYGIVLWGACSSADFNRIFRLQKQAVRLLCNIPRTESCKPHFERLGILTLPSLYILEVCCFVKNNPHLVTSLGIHHDYSTRHKHSLLEIPRHRSSRYEHKPSYRGSTYINKLPAEIRAIPTVKAFKNKLKLYLLQKSLYFVTEL